MLIFLIIVVLLAIGAFVAFKLNPSLEIPLHKSFVLWSQRANLFASIAIAYIVSTNGALIASACEYLPPVLQPVKGPLSGFLAFMVVSYLRLLPQSKPTPNA